MGDQQHLGLDGIANDPGRRAAAWGNFGTVAGAGNNHSINARGNATGLKTSRDVLIRNMIATVFVAIAVPS